MRSVRIFSYDVESGEYTFRDFRASAWIEDGIVTESGGARRRCEGTVRLMTQEEAGVRPGDYASLYFDEKPDKNRDFQITAVRDNRRGGLPHWKLTVYGGGQR